MREKREREREKSVMDESLYDEFGNYIGPMVDSDEEDMSPDSSGIAVCRKSFQDVHY